LENGQAGGQLILPVFIKKFVADFGIDLIGEAPGPLWLQKWDDPIIQCAPKRAITLSRNDWHSPANGAVV
jgi:hypothetical protein